MVVIGRVKEIMKSDEYPSVFDLISDEEIKDKDIILDYLKKGRVTAAAPAIVHDIVSGERINIELLMMDDGKYAWRSDVIYYFEKYNMCLSDDFVLHVYRKLKLKAVDDFLNEYGKNGTSGVICPICRTALSYIQSGNSFIVKCGTADCLYSAFRGI